LNSWERKMNAVPNIGLCEVEPGGERSR
jgi:hypothetical protein